MLTHSLLFPQSFQTPWSSYLTNMSPNHHQYTSLSESPIFNKALSPAQQYKHLCFPWSSTAIASISTLHAPAFIHIVTIDEIQNQSFIIECTSSQHCITLVDVCENKFQTQKAFDYKNLDAQLQIYLLCQHSFRVRVRI